MITNNRCADWAGCLQSWILAFVSIWYSSFYSLSSILSQKRRRKKPLIGISRSRKKLKQISLIWVCIHMYFNLDSAVIVGFFFLWWGGFFSYSFLCKNSLVLLALFVTKARISIRGLIWGVVWWSNFRFLKLEARS